MVLIRTRKIFVRLISIGLSLYVLANVFRPLPPLQERALFLLLVLVTVFLKNPSGKSQRWHGLVPDLFFSLLVFLIFGYVVVQHEAITAKIGTITWQETVMGVIACLLIMESVRRTIGWPLVGITAFFMLYTFFGQYLPYRLGGHGGFSIGRFFTYVYLSMNGIFGIVVYVLFKYVYLFIIFGKLLEKTGALNFIMNLALAMVGGRRGGPALVAVVSSGLVGTISGSAMANVMITGTVTIPLMKRLGFEPHVAGGIEAAASTGGQFMPPVMGATAFLMMEFVGVSYLSIMKAAVIPAILYFTSVGVFVYLYAVRSGIQGMPRNELPQIGQVMRRHRWEGLTFIGGFTTLVALLVLHYSIIISVLLAIITMVLLMLPSKQRLTPKRGMAVLEDAAMDFVSLGAAGACVGIFMGVVLLTGLAMRLSGVIVELAGGAFIPTLIFSMIASIILGTALPTSVCYIILAVLIAPALEEMGVVPLAVHLFIFYAGLMAMVTPPVGMAGYAGATIAGATFFRTCATASMISFSAYIIPFAFVLNHSLLMMGSPIKVVLATLSTAISVTFLSACLAGPIKYKMEVAKRAILFPGAILLIIPSYHLNLLGLCLGLIGLVPQQLLIRGWEGLKLRMEKKFI